MQNRRKKSWPGVTFPGGHVEPWEALVPSVIREIKEETGLDIENVKLCGVKEWFEDGVALWYSFYKPTVFRETCSHREVGRSLLVMERISEHKLASDFMRNLELFLSEDISELIYEPVENGVLEY